MMPEETPDNSAERLQRYAQERREQAGDFSLHPATRRILQGEVARTFGAKSAPGTATEHRGFMAWLNSWTARFAIGATAVVLVGGVVIWRNIQPEHSAMELASAPLASEALLAGTEGAKGFAAKETQLALAAAPASQPVELARKAEPLTRTTVLLAESGADVKELSLSKSGADKMAVMENAAQNSRAPSFQNQSAGNALADNATISLTPVAQNQAAFTYAVNETLPGAAVAQTFNYANAGGQSLARGAQFNDNNLRFQNQAEQAPGGAPQLPPASANYARNDTRAFADNENFARAQNAVGGVMQNDAYAQVESRARSLRSAGPAPAATPAPVVTAEPESQLRGALAAGATANDEAATRFYRAAPATALAAKAKDADALSVSGMPVAVLNDFTIEQRGQTVRLVDGDGSVYEGALETPPMPAFVPATLAPRESTDAAREKLFGAQAEAPARHQELSFRAAGSNVTLRQTVVVNGRFSPRAEPTRAGRAQPAEAPSKQNDFAARRGASGGMSNVFAGRYGVATNAAAATIEGTVRIGTTNQQWFRANRRAP